MQAGAIGASSILTDAARPPHTTNPQHL